MIASLALSAALILAPVYPSQAPAIGNLELPPKYWAYILEAAELYDVSPYVVLGVCAIESRYDPTATSGRGRCVGLMQLDRETAASIGVDPWDPRQNIHGGAFILAKLIRRYKGNVRRAVRKYNGTGNQAYLREVLKAIAQAEENAGD